MTSCNLRGSYWRFAEICCFHLHSQSHIVASTSKAIRCSAKGHNTNCHQKPRTINVYLRTLLMPAIRQLVWRLVSGEECSRNFSRSNLSGRVWSDGKSTKTVKRTPFEPWTSHIQRQTAPARQLHSVMTTSDDNRLKNINRTAKKIYYDLSQRASNISVSGIITYKFETLLSVCLSVCCCHDSALCYLLYGNQILKYGWFIQR